MDKLERSIQKARQRPRHMPSQPGGSNLPGDSAPTLGLQARHERTGACTAQRCSLAPTTISYA